MNRKILSWMWLDKETINNLSEYDWKHYKNGGCLCYAYSKSECLCGSWHKKSDIENNYDE